MQSPFLTGYSSGRNSPYGEQALLLLQSLAEQRGLDCRHYAELYYNSYSDGFEGYMNASTVVSAGVLGEASCKLVCVVVVYGVLSCSIEAGEGGERGRVVYVLCCVGGKPVLTAKKQPSKPCHCQSIGSMSLRVCTLGNPGWCPAPGPAATRGVSAYPGWLGQAPQGSFIAFCPAHPLPDTLQAFLRTYGRGLQPPATGADDAQADCIARLAPLVALYAGDERLMQLTAAVTRVTQDTAAAVAWACAGAAVLERLMGGEGAAAAVRATVEELQQEGPGRTHFFHTFAGVSV